MSIFTKIFSGEGTNIIKAVGGILDDVITSKEEKLELANEETKSERNFLLEQKRLGVKEQEIYLLDTQNARNNETKRDSNKNASWLSKNIHELIALIVIFSWISTWFIGIEPELRLQITGAVMLILGYLYGRSKPES